MEELEIILEVENDNEQEINILEEEIKEIYPELEDLEVTPTKEKQIFKSSKYGYDVVTVNGADLKEDLSTELTEQNNLITTQETTIEDIINALENKSAGGGIDTSDATATSDDLLFGKTAYVNEEKIEGTIETWDGTFEGDAERYQPLNDYLRGRKTEITADDMANVLAIRAYIFYKAPITSVEIGSRTTQIGEYAFSGTSITEITLPNNIMSLGAGVFENCKQLIAANLSKNITSIPDKLFNGCAVLAGIEIPEKVASIGTDAFRNCNRFTEIEIPKSVTSIGATAFFECFNITSLTIPDSVTNIGGYAFANITNLESVVIGSGLKTTGNNIFDNCSKLTSVTIRDGATLSGWSIFSRCTGLTEITIPSSVTGLGHYVFSGCSNLASITLKGVKGMAQYVFKGCLSLKEFICLTETPPSIQSNTLDGVPSDCIFYVPATSVEAYKSATNWSVRADYIVAYEEV